MNNPNCELGGRIFVSPKAAQKQRAQGWFQTPIRLPEDLTSDWLSNTLNRQILEDGFKISSVGTGQMSSTVRVNFREQGKEPESIIVKFSSTDESTQKLGRDLGAWQGFLEEDVDLGLQAITTTKPSSIDALERS